MDYVESDEEKNPDSLRKNHKIWKDYLLGALYDCYVFYFYLDYLLDQN